MNNNKYPTPQLGKNVYIAPTSYVAGSVIVGDDVTIMHHVVIRGDIATIRVGNRCNIQDGSVLHTRYGVDLDIGDEVGVGHRAVVHCRRVGRGTLIGIGSIVLDNAEVGAGCVVAAGAVVTPGMVVPDGKLVAGVPAKVIRDVGERDHEYMRHVIESYIKVGREHAEGKWPAIKSE